VQKVVGNQQKDIRQKPQMSIFYGKRVYQKEVVNDAKQKELEQNIDSGLLCFVRQRGNVLIKDFLFKKPKNLVHE
jgi:hypothetical protein